MPRARGCAGAAHMLFLDGAYAGGAGSAKFRWVKAPTSSELNQLTHTIAQRLARYLERQELLEKDIEHSYLTMDQLRGHSITYRIAVGPQQGHKVFTLQTLPDERDACETPGTTAGNVAGFSLHAGVAAKANQRAKLERLCRYIALQGCRVLRRLGTIASAPARRYPKSGCH